MQEIGEFKFGRVRRLESYDPQNLFAVVGKHPDAGSRMPHGVGVPDPLSGGGNRRSHTVSEIAIYLGFAQERMNVRSIVTVCSPQIDVASLHLPNLRHQASTDNACDAESSYVESRMQCGVYSHSRWRLLGRPYQSMKTNHTDRYSIRDETGLLRFFLLTILLSIPFYVLGHLAQAEVLPRLPVSSGMVVAPAIAAMVMARRSGSRRLLLTAGTGIGWHITATLTPPMVLLGSFLWLRAAGTEVPLPQIEPGRIAPLFALFLVGAAAEEIGWSGFATRPLADRFGYLKAALILSAVTIVWHVIPLLQAGRDPSFILWWAVKTTAHRVMIVYLFGLTGGSTLSATLFHAMSNLSWQLFPIHGSFYDPMSAGIIATAVAAGLVLGVGRKGPRPGDIGDQTPSRIHQTTRKQKWN